MDARQFTCVDHLLTLCNIQRHGLFANDMLTGSGRPDGVFGMHGIGQDNINNINIRVLGNFIEGAVVIDMRIGDLVLFSVEQLLLGRPSDKACQVAMLRMLEGRRQLPHGVPTQAYKCDAQTFLISPRDGSIQISWK